MAKKRGGKRKKRRKSRWPPTRRIDGKTFELMGVHSRKATANAQANQLRRGGHQVRVLDSPGSYAVYVYDFRDRLTERQEDVALGISNYRYGKAKSSEIKSQFVWDEKGDTESKISKDVLDLKKEGILEKTEPKGDIEPTWKLTKRGREFTDYDPHAFDE